MTPDLDALRIYKGFIPENASDMTRNPPEFTGWMDEQLSWKQSCYLGDWSFVPQIGIKGPDALRLFKDLSVNNLDNFPLARAKHCVQCNDDGKVISEGILLRHGEDHFEYQVGTPQWVWYNLKKGGYDAEAYVPYTYKLQISGPNALALCEKLAGMGLRDTKFMYRQAGQIDDLDVTFLRQGMAGEIGFELQGPIAEREKLIGIVLEAGREFGIRRLGARTFMINHLEACYPTGGQHFYNALADETKADYRAFMADDANLLPGWRGGPFETVLRYSISAPFSGSWDGDDIRELYRSPVEMGWGKSIAFDHDFVGRAALEAEVANPRRKVVTLEFDSDGVLRVQASLFGDGVAYRQFEIPDAPFRAVWTDLIRKDGRTIGHATRPGYSYFFRKIIALSFIDVAYAEPGTEVGVLWGDPGTPQIELKAVVKPAPYKPDNRRIDLKALA